MIIRWARLAILAIVLAGWTPHDTAFQVAQNAESGEKPVAELAERETSVGRFYMDKRNYTAAINRFKTVITRYSTSAFAEEALARLAEAYSAIGIASEARCAVAVLQRKFPDSPWSRRAFEALRSAGFEPAENENSYISRAFR